MTWVAQYQPCQGTLVLEGTVLTRCSSTLCTEVRELLRCLRRNQGAGVYKQGITPRLAAPGNTSMQPRVSGVSRMSSFGHT